MRYAQVVIGPAGCGKSTYCTHIVQYAEAIHRKVYVVNMDPAAEHFEYPCIADIRDLISVADVMEDEDLKLGPNGSLVFCMNFLMKNLDWLQEKLGFVEDDYILFDCPGQIELYTHLPFMRAFVRQLEDWEFRVCAVHCIDAHYMVDLSKFFSGALAALSAMVMLGTPAVNMVTKIDTLSESDKNRIDRFLEVDTSMLDEPDLVRGGGLRILHRESKMDADENIDDADESSGSASFTATEKKKKSDDDSGEPLVDPFTVKHRRLTKAIASVLDNFALVQFLPFDISDEDVMGEALMVIDAAIQYGEDLESRPRDFEETADSAYGEDDAAS